MTIMKKHAFTLWLTIVGLLMFCINTSIADAGGVPTDTTITTSFDASMDLTPYLMNGCKKIRLDWVVEGNDTLYTYNNCGAIVKVTTGKVKWLSNFGSAMERQAFASKWLGRRAMYAALGAAGYDNRQADSLTRAIEKVVNSNADSRPLISRVMANSPNAKRLLALEEQDKSFEKRLKDIETSLNDSTVVTQLEFREELVDVWTSMETVGTFAKAADEQLSKTRGHSWTKTKRKHGLTIVHEAPVQEANARSEAMPKPRHRL